MKLLSIWICLTIASQSLGCFYSPSSYLFSQSTYARESTNNEPPHFKDGGSRFYQPSKNQENLAVRRHILTLF